MAGFLSGLAALTGIGGGVATAADKKQSLPDRIMGGVGALGTGLSSIGGLLAPGLSATAATSTASTIGMAGMSMGEIGGLALAGGEVAGAGAGLGALAVPAGAVLGAGALGYGAGRLIDNGVGTISSALGGDGRSLSDRIGDGLYNQLGAGPGLWLADHLPSWMQ